MKGYSVPNLNLDAKVVNVDIPRPELNPKSGLMIRLKATFGKPEEEARLPNTYIVTDILESPMMMNLNMKS